jgi:hypothetical protein
MTRGPEPHSLRLSNCPACGYELEGLAPEGTCPECGEAYDQSVVVLHGYGAGGDIATARPRAALLAGGFYLLMLWWYLGGSIRTGGRDPFMITWATLSMLWIGWSLWKRAASDMPGLVQVRLSPLGASQIRNPAAGRVKPGPVTPWNKIAFVRIRSSGAETAKIRLVGPTTFWRGKQIIVDAEVRITQQQAQALVERVSLWHGTHSAGKTAGAT